MERFNWILWVLVILDFIRVCRIGYMTQSHDATITALWLALHQHRTEDHHDQGKT